MKKRLLSMLLALAMILGMLPISALMASAESTEIPNLHRGVLENCEDTDYVYWDAVAETDYYRVEIYRDGAYVTFDTVWFDRDLKYNITGRDKWIVENMLWFYKAGTYTVKVIAYDTYGDQERILASSEISFDVNKEEQVGTNWTWEDNRALVNVKSGENVKFTVGKDSNPQSMAITKSLLDKAKCELAYVKGVDWLSANWNEDDELELVGTVPNNCPKGEYTVYVGFKSKNGNTGFVFECAVMVSANTYVSQILINPPRFIPTYWEIYKPDDAGFEYSYPRLTLNIEGKSFIADWAGDTDGLRWDDYVDNLKEFTYDRCFYLNLFRVTDTGARIDVSNSEHTIIEGMYEYVWTIPLKDFDPDGNEVMYADDLKVYLGNYLTEVDKIERVDNSNDKLKVYQYYYIYDEKPEINSVKVNGESVADGGTITSNKGNVTIATNYDGLSDALTAYGCSVKQLAAYYLNGEKINVAMINPVDNGDGTYTKSYTRTLTPGDELRVESWLEVRWPDGHTDRVDEYTVTVSRPAVAFDFANQNPVGSADETTGLTATSGDTKSYTFGSTAVPSGYYVEKKATLKGLFAGLDADQTVTVKDGSAATLTHTFIKPGLYQLTETLKLYENGSTKAIATKSHQFLIEVAAADPAFVTQPHYEGKGMQMGTNYVSWQLNFTPVKLIARCNIGTHDRPNIKEYELDPTKSFAALVAYSQKYVLYAYYGEGDRDYVASDAFSAEKPAEFTPAFTKQPVGDESLGGNPVEVTWATNFVPVKISIMQGSVKPTMEHSVLDDATATSTLLGASENNYFICAYYSDTEYVTSNKFQITELAPAFTLQPADGVSLGGAYAEVTWATNFTPVKLALVKINRGPNDRPFYTYEELDVDATYCMVEPGFEEYAIRAYYNDTEYVTSEHFSVTEMNYYNAWFYVDDTVLDKVMVLEGDYVERPADPVKDGYTFLGWYTDDGEMYNFAAPVTADVHLTAKFEVAATFLKGDFDADGVITVSDALAALRIAAKIVEETAEAIEIGDMDSDGKITVSDALAILRIAAKIVG